MTKSASSQLEGDRSFIALPYQMGQCNPCGKIFIIQRYDIIAKLTGNLLPFFAANLNLIEKNMRGCVPQSVFMREYIQAATGHHAPAGRVVEIPHLLKGRPEEREVFCDHSGFLSEVGAKEAEAFVKAIWNEGLPSHRAGCGLLVIVFTGLVTTILQRHSGDRQIQRCHGINGPGKSHLDRASHLAAVVTFAFLPNQHSSEHAHVVIVLAHPRLGLVSFAVVSLLCPYCGISTRFVISEKASILDEDFVPFFLPTYSIDPIPHFPFE